MTYDVLAPGSDATEIGFAHRTCDIAGPFVVNSAGTHTIKVSAPGPQTGSYGLLLDVAPPA